MVFPTRLPTRLPIRSTLAAGWLLALLAGCGGGGGSPFAPPGVTTSGGGGGGDYNQAVVTPSANPVTVGVGGSQTLALTVTSSDGQSISDFSFGTALAALPAGWAGPATFTCGSASTGSGCLLHLTYTPTAVGSGSLVLPFTYKTHAGTSSSSALTISYAAQAANQVTSAVAPAGQVAVALGATQPVIVTFFTDDGTPATAFQLTSSLAGLPAGWKSEVSALTCATVTAGNGCVLALSYAPTSASSGTLPLTYRYVNTAGITRTGTVSVSYVATSNETVVGTASPSGQVTALLGAGSQHVTVTFTTSGGSSATQLQVTGGLLTLPASWQTATPDFSCATVGTDNGCALSLTFNPGAPTSGTLALAYHYTDNAGTTKSGTVAIPYTATVHNNVVAAVSPTGTVTGIEGGSQTIGITFTTDDAFPVTAFGLTSNLALLPAGWSAPFPGFTCSSVSTGNSCRLALTFAPATLASGSLQIGYGYVDNAGSPQTGSVSVPYVTLSNDSLVATVAPSGQVIVAPNATPQPLTVTFTSNDGAPISNVAITSDLTALPSSWSTSTPVPFSCTQASTGTACQLALTYAPVAVESGTLQLAYRYTNNAGATNTGSLQIPYATQVSHVYVVQPATGVYACAIAGDGSLSGCALTGGGYAEATGIAISGTTAYVSDFRGSAVWACAVNTDATLTGCATTSAPVTNPQDLTIANGSLYIANGTTAAPTVCTIGAGGALSGCTAASSELTANWDLYIGSTYAYATGASGLQRCALTSGQLTGCASAGAGFAAPYGLTVSGSYLYVANQNTNSVRTCAMLTDGSLGTCSSTPVGFGPSSLIVTSSQAYVSDASGKVYQCTANTDGTLQGCTALTTGLPAQPIAALLLH